MRSPRRGEWLQAEAQGLRSCERRGDEGLAVDRDFKPVAAGGSDARGEEAVFAGQLSISETLLGRW
jgi:hypothetical protein